MKGEWIFFYFSIRARCTATTELKKKKAQLSEPIQFFYFRSFRGAFRNLSFLSVSFCPHLTLYQTLDCLDFLRRGFVPAVIPMWNLYSPHSLTQWKCDVYMYRFLVLFSSLSLSPPSLHPPCFELIWLLPHTPKGNGTASKYDFHRFTHEPVARGGNVLCFARSLSFTSTPARVFSALHLFLGEKVFLVLGEETWCDWN